ncbi:MAG: cytochrome-c peroxidase [Bacteroidetes bacterium]|nr:cytochrome-c peroxidase [Bacteroidota bacterium]
MSVLIEFFNPYEIKFLNGPNLNRIESDVPDLVIKPSGFQVIEDELYAGRAPDHKKIMAQADIMLKYIGRIETETDRVYKFRKELVFASLRSSLITITTMGITGFDSPVAFHSIQEASESIAGIKQVLTTFKEDIDKVEPSLYAKLNAQIVSCIQYLTHHKDFNSFNRLEFITSFINPLANSLTYTGKKLNLIIPQGNTPVNNSSQNIFSENAFNPNFFSPGIPYDITEKRVALGRRLFYDSILSSNKKRSCASCHKPEKAFTDGLKTALSIDDTTYLSRNTPTLLNSVFQTKLFWDSRTSLLENQLDEVVHNEKEMKGSLKQSVAHLKANSFYSTLFKEAYPEEKNAVIEFNIANAISSYVRSLISLNSRFDKYMRGNVKALTASEKNGFNLFAGKAKCATCHFIPLFNGLVPPVFTETESEILGVPQTKDKTHAILDTDIGKAGFTTSVIHKFAFKTPTLRNIELTAPYMHNGVYTTLEEVMEFYNNGGGKGLKIAPANQSLPFDKLNLSKKEIGDIISFMKALTDTVYSNHFTR